MSAPLPPRVLIVCTANAIRSPFVEHLLRARLVGSRCSDTVIDSAGCAARPGNPAAPQVIEIGRTWGLDLEEHRTRRLDEGVLNGCAAVLCAAAAHRRTVLDMRPDLLDSTFMVKEFARLLAEGESEIGQHDDWSSLARATARYRTRARFASAGDDDLVDPIGQPSAVWDRFESDAVAAVDAISAQAMRLLRGPASGRRTEKPPATRRELRARTGPSSDAGPPGPPLSIGGRG